MRHGYRTILFVITTTLCLIPSYLHFKIEKESSIFHTPLPRRRRWVHQEHKTADTVRMKAKTAVWSMCVHRMKIKMASSSLNSSSSERSIFDIFIIEARVTLNVSAYLPSAPLALVFISSLTYSLLVAVLFALRLHVNCAWLVLIVLMRRYGDDYGIAIFFPMNQCFFFLAIFFLVQLLPWTFLLCWLPWYD